MKLAHLVPVSLLDCLPSSQRTHLILSDLVLTNSKYLAFYCRRKAKGDTIILDNPVHENGKVTIEDWLAAIELLRPDVAILPDIIDDTEETVNTAFEAISQFYDRFGHIACSFMAVPHAKMQLDWQDCARQMSMLPGVSHIGISLERRLNDDDEALERREERVTYICDNSAIFGNIRIHLLGISERGTELGANPIWNRVDSADTSKFSVFCLADSPVWPPLPVLRPYPGRAYFGGSEQFFGLPRISLLSRMRLRSNLASWSTYAESVSRHLESGS